MLLSFQLQRVVSELLFGPRSIRIQSHLLRLATWPRGATPTTGRAERIVVVKLDGIGDFVLVTPFLRELRRARPGAWISLVASPLVESLARSCPHIDELVVAPRAAPGLRGIIRHWTAWIAISWRRLLPLRATLAILPRWDSDIYDAFALLSLSGAAHRVSYSSEVSLEKSARNRGSDLLLTVAVLETAHLHEVERNLDLLRALGLPVASTSLELWPAADGARLSRELLGPRAAGTVVALCPFSAELVKDWPFGSFLSLVESFPTQPHLTFVLFATADYAAIADDPRLRALPHLAIAIGRFSLDETAAFLARCSLVVSVDTGLAHIAAALRRPLVLISGQPAGHAADSRYSLERFGPWQSDCTVVAPPPAARGPRRIVAVEVATVAAAVSARLPVHS